MRFEPLRILQVLENHDVEFVVIGGLAGVAHGSSLVTNDLDICHERSLQNLTRLAEALASLDTHLRGVEDEVEFILDARSLAAGDSFAFTTTAGDLDCFATPAGTSGHDALAANTVTLDLDGFAVRVAALEDLIRMKRAAGRPQDRIALEILGALRDEIEAGPDA